VHNVLEIVADKFSETAAEKIQAADGEIEALNPDDTDDTTDEE
jgi:ribosomal protein L18E